MTALRPIAQAQPIARRPLAPAARSAATAPGPVRPVAERPSVGQTWSRLFASLVTGRNVVLPGAPPAYTPLDAAALEAAVVRGAGRTAPQAFSTGDQAGAELQEPVNLLVRGRREDLERALTARGWVKADDRSAWSFFKAALSSLFHLGHFPAAPVSAQYVNGQAEVMAFNKNSDYNLARDHMRVYDLGDGTWAIAATRDVALSITPPRLNGWHLSAPGIGHVSEKRVDPERDMIMRDLLASGRVTDWAAVEGDRPPGLAGERQADGRLNIRGFETDGRLYQVTLG